MNAFRAYPEAWRCELRRITGIRGWPRAAAERLISCSATLSLIASTLAYELAQASLDTPPADEPVSPFRGWTTSSFYLKSRLESWLRHPKRVRWRFADAPGIAP